MLEDFNCDHLSPQPYRPSSVIKSIAELYQLEQLITEPTRCTMYTSTLIDLIYTNYPNRVVASGVIHLGTSDHALIYSVRKIAIPKNNSHNVVFVRNMKNFSVERNVKKSVNLKT